MKTAILSITFLVGCMATAVPRRSLFDEAWTAGVWKPAWGSNITFFGEAVSASGGAFYMHKNTSSYCPSDVMNLDCSLYPGGETVFIGGNGTVSLNVAVPGGQQVYIAPDGHLAYTVAHSAAIPEGSITTGFTRERSEAFGAPVGLYNAGRSWYICPVATNSMEQVYQIYLTTEDKAKNGCIGSMMRTYGPAKTVAWEYA